jgi:hypothetical protein
MPFSLSTIRCRLDPDLDAALFDYQERLGEQLLAARAQLDTIRALGATVTSSFSEPLRSSLDAILATAGTSTEGVIDATRLVDGDSTADIEAAIGDRFGMTIVNGRLILPGTRDLSAIQLFSRVLGGFEEIFRVLPDLAEVPITDDTDFRTYSTPLEITPRFVMVTTYMRKTVTPETSCTAEVVVEEEVTIGIDRPLSEAAASVGISIDDVRIYIFWIGRPEATDATRRKSRVLGLTNSQFVDAVSKTSRENFIVSVIPDPSEIARVAGAFGDDADDVVRRLTGPVELFPSAEDMASLIRDTLRRSTPGSSGPSGMPDFSSPGVAIFSTLDINSTFGLDSLAESLIAQEGENLSATQYAEAVGNAIKSQLAILSTIIEEAQAVITSILNEITNLVSVVNMLFNDMANGLLDCLFGSSFSPSGGSFASVSGSVTVGIGGIGGAGSPGTPGTSTSNPLDGVLAAIEGQATTITEFLRAVSNLLGIVSDVSCGSSFVSSSSAVQPSFGGSLPCQADVAREAGFELPTIFEEALGITKVVMDVLTSLFDTVRTALRGLRTTVSSLSLSLRVSLERRNSSSSASSLPSPPGSPGCAPPEATRLAALLVARSIAGFTPPSV